MKMFDRSSKAEVLGDIFSNRCSLEFRQLTYDYTYHYVLPFAKIQLAKQYSEQQARTDSNDEKWYVEFFGYFAKDVEMGLAGSEAKHYISRGAPVSLSFSGHGFYFKLQRTPFKDASISEMGDRDGLLIEFRRKKDKNGAMQRSWDVLHVTAVAYAEYPELIKKEEETYGKPI